MLISSSFRLTRSLGRRMYASAERLKGFDAPTVWSEFTPLANKHGSINLGQGFPDWPTPTFIKEALIESINENANQYTRSAGDISLVTALAEHYSLEIGRTIDPLTEVTVTVGATEAIFAAMQSLVNPNDEVVVLEPSFDIYPAAIQMAGGISKAVALELNEKDEWVLDMKALEAAITPKTKIFILNTPHNPTGKVFTLSELESIRDIVLKFPNLIVILDEVYEKLVYDNKKHIHLASLENMWERCLTVSSCGKTFSATGWKVGWVYGPKELVSPIVQANQWIQFCVSSPTQRAISKILKSSEKPYENNNNYYEFICKEYERKRNFLAECLKSANIKPVLPEGGFFIMADTSVYEIPEKYINEPGPNGESPVTRDWGFARYLTVDHGITPIPPSAFYTTETRDKAKNLARFAYCKTDDYLLEAKKRFEKLGEFLKQQK